MKILQFNDTHEGITTQKQIAALCRQAAKEEFDLIVHCGDYCGGVEGWKKVRNTVKAIRKQFPDKPFVSVIGNHDYWMKGKRRRVESLYTGLTTTRFDGPSGADFVENLNNIIEVFKENNVHFLDTDGIYQHADFPEIVIIGNSGWYNNPYPPTNDALWLPKGLEGDTHRHLLKRAEMQLWKDDADLQKHRGKTVIFVSHFPVIPAKGDERFETFSWNKSIGYYFQEEYSCKYFLNGHAHQSHFGPLRYETGTDYGKPKYQIIEIKP